MRSSLLVRLIDLYAWGGLLLLTLELASGRLGANPIQALQIRSGRGAFTFLLLTLAATPLQRLFGWRALAAQRRRLGLYTLLYATLHALIFIHWDYGLAWDTFRATVLEKPYLLWGSAALLLLLPLGMTSFDVWKQRLGRNWKRLHRLVYLVFLLALVHVTLSQKGSLLTVQGNLLRPLIYAVSGGILLLLRLRHR